MATAPFDGEVYVFAVAGERAWFQVFDIASGTWFRSDAWTEVPGNGITDRPLAAASSRDALYLFAVGKGDRQVYVNRKSVGGGPTGGWSGW